MDDKLEKLAALEHEQWMGWARAVILEVSEERAERWNNLFVPYKFLSEENKEQDRVYAKKVLEAIK